MTAAGFDWSYQPQPASNATTSVAPKSQRKDTEMRVVMDIATTQKIVTLKAAQKKLKDSAQRAAYILRELTIQGKLTKEGRGKTAQYKKS